MKTTAIIPVYNNPDTIGSIARKTEKYVDSVIVVDDGSRSSTKRVLKRLSKRKACTVLTHKKNRGKGAAIRTALAHLEELSKNEQPDAVVFLDADGEHLPREIPKFIRRLQKVDVVLGSRTAYRSKKRRRLNKLMAFWFQLLHRDVKDPSCGFRAFTYPLLQRLELTTSDFCIDAEMILESIKARASIISVSVSPITYSESSVSQRDYAKINNFFDQWVLNNAHQPFTYTKKRPLLLTGVRVGRILGKVLLRKP